MKMRCCLCGENKEENEITITDTRKIVCKKCNVFYTDYHFNNFDFENGSFEENEPFKNITEERQRELVIDYIHLLFSDKVSKRTYSLLSTYRKKYSYLQIIRALEYHFKIKKGDINKAKGSIGILPYVIQDSEKYYKAKNRFLKDRFLKQVKAEVSEIKTVNAPQKEEKKDKIDITKL